MRTNGFRNISADGWTRQAANDEKTALIPNAARENGSYGHGAEYLWMRNQEEMTQVRGIWLALLDRVLAEGRPGLPGIL